MVKLVCPSAPRRSAHCSPGSAASIAASSKLAGGRPGRSKSTPPTGLSLLIDFPMPGNSATSATAAAASSPGSTASRRGSRARTSASAAAAARKGARAWPDRGRDCSLRSYASLGKYNPLGWYLRTSRRCSIPTIAATCRRSSVPLPTAGMWDSGECLMLSISESPRSVAGFSWSRVLDATPRSTTWLTPGQWRLYLARLLRSASMRLRAGGLAILSRHQTLQAVSVSAMKFSSLKRTHGIRWLSGRECLAYMGFPKGWMRSISPSALRRATRSSR